MTEKFAWLMRQFRAYMDFEKANSHTIGWFGEQIAIESLKARGYIVKKLQKNHQGDLHVINRRTGEVIRLEVKISKRGKSGRWQFCTNKNDDHGYTSCSDSDCVLLIAVGKAGVLHPFLIPSKTIGETKKITLSSHPENYTGKYSKFRTHMSALNVFQEVSA